MFESNKKKEEQNLFRFDRQLDDLVKTCEKIQRKTKNYQNFSQEVRTTGQYIQIANLEKMAYQKLLSDTKNIKERKVQIENKSKQLIDALLQIQNKKQLLQTSVHSYDAENQYLSNVGQRIDEQIDLIKDNQIELNASNVNQITFQKYLKDLIDLKELQIKKKCLGN